MPERKPTLTAPSKGTLRKYGLSEAEWRAVCRRQGDACPICLKPLAGRKLAVDHRHVPRWKRMKTADRRKHVRGVLHNFCNRYYVRRWASVATVRALLAYLEAHERRNGK